MLTSASWLIRAGAYALIGADLFGYNSYGPTERTVVTVAFALCGVLLAVWAALDLRKAGTPLQRTVVLGLLAVVSSPVAVQTGNTALVAMGMIATIDAGTEILRSAGWAVFCAALLSAEVGVLAGDVDLGNAAGVPLLLAVGLLTGFNRRAYRVEAEQSRALLVQAEKLRLEQGRVAVLDERTRIAREIHDVLAHSLGALGIQIQAARALLTDDQDVDRAVEVLTTAQRMASDGLVETRRAVHALRTGAAPLGEELARMAATHERRHEGTVAVAVAGDAVPLPPDQALALVRTAQESLTNAAKHAPHRPVTVELRYGDEDVTLTLTNPVDAGGEDGGSADDSAGAGGNAAADGGAGVGGGSHAAVETAAKDGMPPDGPAAGFATVNGGYGLTGMRERLLLLGGTLTAGTTNGRWTVTAQVPRGQPTHQETAS